MRQFLFILAHLAESFVTDFYQHENSGKLFFVHLPYGIRIFCALESVLAEFFFWDLDHQSYYTNASAKFYFICVKDTINNTFSQIK